MIQQIRNVRTGCEFVCEIPEGWNAALLSDGKGGVMVVMVYHDCPPRVLERGEDGVWRQREISLP